MRESILSLNQNLKLFLRAFQGYKIMILFYEIQFNTTYIKKLVVKCFLFEVRLIISRYTFSTSLAKNL